MWCEKEKSLCSSTPLLTLDQDRNQTFGKVKICKEKKYPKFDAKSQATKTYVCFEAKLNTALYLIF